MRDWNSESDYESDILSDVESDVEHEVESDVESDQKEVDENVPEKTFSDELLNKIAGCGIEKTTELLGNEAIECILKSENVTDEFTDFMEKVVAFEKKMGRFCVVNEVRVLLFLLKHFAEGENEPIKKKAIPEILKKLCSKIFLEQKAYQQWDKRIASALKRMNNDPSSYVNYLGDQEIKKWINEGTQPACNSLPTLRWQWHYHVDVILKAFRALKVDSNSLIPGCDPVQWRWLKNWDSVYDSSFSASERRKLLSAMVIPSAEIQEEGKIEDGKNQEEMCSYYPKSPWGLLMWWHLAAAHYSDKSFLKRFRIPDEDRLPKSYDYIKHLNFFQGIAPHTSRHVQCLRDIHTLSTIMKKDRKKGERKELYHTIFKMVPLSQFEEMVRQNFLDLISNGSAEICELNAVGEMISALLSEKKESETGEETPWEWKGVYTFSRKDLLLISDFILDFGKQNRSVPEAPQRKKENGPVGGMDAQVAEATLVEKFIQSYQGNPSALMGQNFLALLKAALMIHPSNIPNPENEGKVNQRPLKDSAQFLTQRILEEGKKGNKRENTGGQGGNGVAACMNLSLIDDRWRRYYPKQTKSKPRDLRLEKVKVTVCYEKKSGEVVSWDTEISLSDFYSIDVLTFLEGLEIKLGEEGSNKNSQKDEKKKRYVEKLYQIRRLREATRNRFSSATEALESLLECPLAAVMPRLVVRTLSSGGSIPPNSESVFQVTWDLREGVQRRDPQEPLFRQLIGGDDEDGKQAQEQVTWLPQDFSPSELKKSDYGPGFYIVPLTKELNYIFWKREKTKRSPISEGVSRRETLLEMRIVAKESLSQKIPASKSKALGIQQKSESKKLKRLFQGGSKRPKVSGGKVLQFQQACLSCGNLLRTCAQFLPGYPMDPVCVLDELLKHECSFEPWELEGLADVLKAFLGMEKNDQKEKKILEFKAHLKEKFGLEEREFLLLLELMDAGVHKSNALYEYRLMRVIEYLTFSPPSHEKAFRTLLYWVNQYLAWGGKGNTWRFVEESYDSYREVDVAPLEEEKEKESEVLEKDTWTVYCQVKVIREGGGYLSQTFRVWGVSKGDTFEVILKTVREELRVGLLCKTLQKKGGQGEVIAWESAVIEASFLPVRKEHRVSGLGPGPDLWITLSVLQRSPSACVADKSIRESLGVGFGEDEASETSGKGDSAGKESENKFEILLKKTKTYSFEETRRRFAKECLVEIQEGRAIHEVFGALKEVTARQANDHLWPRVDWMEICFSILELSLEGKDASMPKTIVELSLEEKDASMSKTIVPFVLKEIMGFMFASPRSRAWELKVRRILFNFSQRVFRSDSKIPGVDPLPWSFFKHLYLFFEDASLECIEREKRVTEWLGLKDRVNLERGVLPLTGSNLFTCCELYSRCHSNTQKCLMDLLPDEVKKRMEKTLHVAPSELEPIIHGEIARMYENEAKLKEERLDQIEKEEAEKRAQAIWMKDIEAFLASKDGAGGQDAGSREAQRKSQKASEPQKGIKKKKKDANRIRKDEEEDRETPWHTLSKTLLADKDGADGQKAASREAQPISQRALEQKKEIKKARKHIQQIKKNHQVDRGPHCFGGTYPEGFWAQMNEHRTFFSSGKEDSEKKVQITIVTENRSYEFGVSFGSVCGWDFLDLIKFWCGQFDQETGFYEFEQFSNCLVKERAVGLKRDLNCIGWEQLRCLPVMAMGDLHWDTQKKQGTMVLEFCRRGCENALAVGQEPSFSSHSSQHTFWNETKKKVSSSTKKQQDGKMKKRRPPASGSDMEVEPANPSGHHEASPMSRERDGGAVTGGLKKQ